MAILRVSCARSFLIRVLAVSAVLALLQLAASLYMLAVYDCVLPSRSAAALAGLTALAVALHLAFAALDAVRARMVCRAGVHFARHLDGLLLAALHARDRASGLPLLDDAERVRRFLTGAGPCAAFDLLWLPAFLATAFVLHPLLGLFACSGGALLGSVTALAERRAREAGRRLMQTRQARYVLAWDLYAGRAGAERRLRWQDTALRWDAHVRSHAETTLHAAERALFGIALGKGLRMVLQSAGFGLGALLVMEDLMSAGALIASSLILARAFACLDGALAHWSGFTAARESSRRLLGALEQVTAGRDLGAPGASGGPPHSPPEAGDGWQSASPGVRS